MLFRSGLSTKFSQDLLFITFQYFEKMEIFKTEIQEPHHNTIFVVCTGFQKSDNKNNENKNLF